MSDHPQPVEGRSNFERRTLSGWWRWRPAADADEVQSCKKLGIFQITVTKREPWEDVWEVDLYRFVAYTQVRADGVEKAEQLALEWALPILAAAFKEANAAVRALRSGQ